MRRLVIFVPVLLIASCDTTRFAATTSASLAVRASEAIEQHWDPELVGDAMPGSILQLEGVYAVAPDDERLGLALLRAYTSYAYGWVEDEAEEAEARGDLDAQEALLVRARLLHERAKNLGLAILRARDAGLDEAIRGGADALASYLEARYRDRESLPLVFWTGYAWLSAINAGRTPELILELPVARAFLERALAIDESYFHYAGLLAIAAMESSTATSVGGDTERGRALFERALAATERRFFAVQLECARTYALGTGNRALYVTLLREIIDGGDPAPELRLANRIARRRAIRALRRVDELF